MILGCGKDIYIIIDCINFVLNLRLVYIYMYFYNKNLYFFKLCIKLRDDIYLILYIFIIYSNIIKGY